VDASALRAAGSNVTVETAVPVEITVDGVVAGATIVLEPGTPPMLRLRLEPGTHTVTAGAAPVSLRIAGRQGAKLRFDARGTGTASVLGRIVAETARRLGYDTTAAQDLSGEPPQPGVGVRDPDTGTGEMLHPPAGGTWLVVQREADGLLDAVEGLEDHDEPPVERREREDELPLRPSPPPAPRPYTGEIVVHGVGDFDVSVTPEVPGTLADALGGDVGGGVYRYKVQPGRYIVQISELHAPRTPGPRSSTATVTVTANGSAALENLGGRLVPWTGDEARVPLTPPMQVPPVQSAPPGLSAYTPPVNSRATLAATSAFPWTPVLIAGGAVVSVGLVTWLVLRRRPSK
jgi:hypothetical protein